MSNLQQYYINGEWVAPARVNLFEVINPATEKSVGQISLGSPADVDKAVAAARVAFATYGKTTWRERADLLGSILDVYKKRVDDVANAISLEMGANFDTDRFVPFVIMHEFEGLLFSDCAAFARGIGQLALEPSFQAIRDQFTTPEDINDSPNTAPSKRIINLMPEYDKPLYGNLAALEIGLDCIRQACPHFRNWLSKLEALAP